MAPDKLIKADGLDGGRVFEFRHLKVVVQTHKRLIRRIERVTHRVGGFVKRAYLALGAQDRWVVAHTGRGGLVHRLARGRVDLDRQHLRARKQLEQTVERLVLAGERERSDFEHAKRQFAGHRRNDGRHALK